MKIEEIPLSKLVYRSNYRIDYDDMPNLMNSIKAHNLLQPIGVKRLTTDNFEIIWGNRRAKAFEKLGYKTIPAVIFREDDENLTEEEFTILQVNENYQRKGTNLQELGTAVKFLKKTMSSGEIAAKFGISRGRVDAAFDEIQRVPVKWQKKIRIMNGNENKKGDIPLGTSMKITRLRGLNVKQREQLYEQVSKDETIGENIAILGSLMKKGKNIKEAVNEIKNYKAISVQFFVDRNKWDEYLLRINKPIRELIVELINNQIPDLAFRNIDFSNGK